MGKMIYLDNPATTKTAPEVVEADAARYFTERVWQSVQRLRTLPQQEQRRRSRKRREARLQVPWVQRTDEIYFTAGGSESDNWALKATAEAYGNPNGGPYHYQLRSSITPSCIPVNIWKR